MSHPIYKVLSFDIIAPYMLHIKFSDHFERTVDFRPVLEGEIYRPLRNLSLFNQVKIDSEIQTLVWPNGADFDPATLHDWPEQVETLADRLRQQELTAA